MSKQATEVLTELKRNQQNARVNNNATTTWYLSNVTGIPMPSVRRAIGELRSNGVMINHSPRRGYTLQAAQQ